MQNGNDDAGAGAPERRRFERSALNRQVFARVIAGADIVGEVVDLSQGGLGLKYLSYARTPLGNTTIDLFGPGGRSYMTNLPASLVCDVEMPIKNSFFDLGVRRMGVAFEPLTQPQKGRLQEVIRQNRISGS